MKILKVAGKSEEVVMEKLKKEYGNQFMLMGSKEERSQGLLGFLRKQFVATVAIDYDEPIERSKDIEDVKEKYDTYKGEPNPFLGHPIMDSLIKDKAIESKKAVLSDEDNILLQISGQLADMKNDVAVLKREKLDIERAKDTLRATIEKGLIETGVSKDILDEHLRDSAPKENVVSLYRDFKASLMGNLNHKLKDMPKIVYFIGSTGVGKTTTIAKLLARKVLDENKKVVLFTADTYRIAAIEQLKTYAEILNVPIEVIYSADEAKQALNKWKDADYIFIDTAGRSHKNTEHIVDLKALLNLVTDKLILLTINVSTRQSDLKDIIDVYRGVAKEFELVVTKLDETNEIGNLINIAKYSGCPIRYITNGQNVPDDIEKFDIDIFVDELIGRVSI